MKQTRLVWDTRQAKFIKASRKNPTEQFIKGPIPAAWLHAAGRLPGKALHIGLAIWQLAGLRSSKRELPLSTERVRAFGVTRQGKSRALAELQLAGLVKVESRTGKTPLVSILRAGTP